MFFPVFSSVRGVNQNSGFINFFAVQHHTHLKNKISLGYTDSFSKVHQICCATGQVWGCIG